MVCQQWEGAAPCIKCGKCCRLGNCAFGEYDPVKKQCRFLTEDNLCGKYEEIITSPPECCADFSPAFGAGCCLRAAKKENSLAWQVFQTLKELENDSKPTQK